MDSLDVFCGASVVKLRSFGIAHRCSGLPADFPDHSFDRVFAAYFISTVPDPVRVIREMKRVCSPGGYLMVARGALHQPVALREAHYSGNTAPERRALIPRCARRAALFRKSIPWATYREAS
ncbi:MAG: class I SAM-dependent methyltransferase [Verrucomicrobia bacterium]|nr:class I SAM-dependent methyltransferase [Verrucomicrobiota bacterium]